MWCWFAKSVRRSTLNLRVGSVGESGKVFVADFADRAGADQAYVNKEAAIQLETIHRRRALYTSVCPSMKPQGRTVIVVDDGLATGATMRAALAEVRDRHPARLICAVPVASAEAASRIRERCDELICLAIETDFQGVGQFFELCTGVRRYCSVVVKTIMRHMTHIPLWAKLILTVYVAVLVPIYWVTYGPTNFLFFL